MDQDINFERHRKLLTRWAWGFTVGYALVLLILASFVLIGQEGVDSFLKMSPNEVGDLLAGIAGPIAFIWLVYGYFLQGIAIKQQSEELRQNTKALELQAEELRKSVEQQTQLVEISRKQLENEIAIIDDKNEKERRQAKPKFIIDLISKRSGSAGNFCQFRLTNVGNTSSDILFFFSQGIIDIAPRKIPLIARNHQQDIEVSLDDRIGLGGLGWIKIVFNDSLGSRGEKIFVFARTKSGHFDHFLSFDEHDAQEAGQT